MTIRTILVDDEKLAIQGLEHRLAAFRRGLGKEHDRLAERDDVAVVRRVCADIGRVADGLHGQRGHGGNLLAQFDGAGEGLAIYMQLDEPTLREVARMTGGEYHHAGTAEELRSVYQDLGSRLQVQTRETELTGLLALLSAVIALVAAILIATWRALNGSLHR